MNVATGFFRDYRHGNFFEMNASVNSSLVNAPTGNWFFVALAQPIILLLECVHSNIPFIIGWLVGLFLLLPLGA
jgi:hypothetical protein